MTGDAPVSADAARSILDDLIRQRRRMRDSAPNASLLEANRLAIVYWQWQLTRAIEAQRTQAVA